MLCNYDVLPFLPGFGLEIEMTLLKIIFCRFKNVCMWWIFGVLLIADNTAECKSIVNAKYCTGIKC